MIASFSHLCSSSLHKQEVLLAMQCLIASPLI
jgi:hypothetical protein